MRDDVDEISAIPLLKAKPPEGHCWAVRRKHLYLAPYKDLSRVRWYAAQAMAKPYGDLRIAGIAAAWLVQFGGVPADELGVVAVPLQAPSPARERALARTVAKARAYALPETDVHSMPKNLVRRAVDEVKRHERHKEAGFAMLLEMLVLCAIMLVLMAAITPNMVKAARAMNYSAARQRAYQVAQAEAASATCHAIQGADCTAVDYTLPQPGSVAGPGGYTFTFTAGPGAAWMYVGVPADPTLPQVAIANNSVLYCGTTQCSATY